MQNSPNKTYSELSHTSNSKTIRDPFKDSDKKRKPIVRNVEVKTNVNSNINPILRKNSSYVVSFFKLKFRATDTFQIVLKM